MPEEHGRASPTRPAGAFGRNIVSDVESACNGTTFEKVTNGISIPSSSEWKGENGLHELACSRYHYSNR